MKVVLAALVILLAPSAAVAQQYDWKQQFRDANRIQQQQHQQQMERQRRAMQQRRLHNVVGTPVIARV